MTEGVAKGARVVPENILKK
jgi:large subunit ribosomal protein L7e